MQPVTKRSRRYGPWPTLRGQNLKVLLLTGKRKSALAEMRWEQIERKIPQHIRDRLFDHAEGRGSGAIYDHHEYETEGRGTARVTQMKMEWLRAGDSAPACWACFLIFDDHVDVLAVIGPNERIDGHMTLTAARKLWSDLKQRGWHHATDAEIDQHQMTHRALRRIAYGRR